MHEALARGALLVGGGHAGRHAPLARLLETGVIDCGQRDRQRDTEQVLDDLEEHLGLAQQVVGLAGADVAAAVDDRPVGRARREEGGPLPQLGRDPGQHLPDAARARLAGWGRCGPRRGRRRRAAHRGGRRGSARKPRWCGRRTRASPGPARAGRARRPRWVGGAGGRRSRWSPLSPNRGIGQSATRTSDHRSPCGDSSWARS